MQMERYSSDKENIRLQRGKSIIKMSQKNIAPQNLMGEQPRSYRIWKEDGTVKSFMKNGRT